MFSRRPKTREELDAMIAANPPTLEREQALRDNSRLDMAPESRIVLASLASFGVGAALGLSQGSTMSGLRFRAEHAHKLPTTPTGWFMYHKSKNYNMARDGLREGVRMGLRVCVVTTAMFFIEDLYDEYRQSKDFINTTLASLTVAGGFSLWSMFSHAPSCDSYLPLENQGLMMFLYLPADRFSLPMTARTTKTALFVGLIYGGLQDVAGVARGRPIGYVDSIRRRLGGKDREGLEKTAP